MQSKETEPNGLDRFKLSPADSDVLADFQLVMSNVNLETVDITAPALRALEKKKGVYFWMMRYATASYKIYVGKTNSLPRRFKEYCNKFQPGVPNDFKLRHFQSWAREIFRHAEIDLYFSQTDDNTARETEILRRTKPFMNERADVSHEALQAAHWEYYQRVFERKLAHATIETKPAVVTVGDKPIALAIRPPVKSAKGPAAGSAIARAGPKFAELGAFRPGSNRAVIYDLLERAGGATLEECRLACRDPNRKSSIITDLYDVAAITQRKLLKGTRDGAEHYYWLEK